MTERRMYSRTVTETDKFLDLSAGAQALYYHLGMEADDDGMIDSPRGIIRKVGRTLAELEELESAGYIIPFDSGVIAVTHWLRNNQIRADRKKPTIHTTEFQQLETAENGAYRLRQPDDNQMTTKCPHSIVKYSIDKISSSAEAEKPESELEPEVEPKEKETTETTTENKTESEIETSIEDGKAMINSKPEETDNKNDLVGMILSTAGDALTANKNINEKKAEWIASEYGELLEASLIFRAIYKAKEAGNPTWNYATDLLKTWKSKGIYTCTAQDGEQKQYKKKPRTATSATPKNRNNNIECGEGFGAGTKIYKPSEKWEKLKGYVLPDEPLQDSKQPESRAC